MKGALFRTNADKLVMLHIVLLHLFYIICVHFIFYCNVGYISTVGKEILGIIQYYDVTFKYSQDM